MLPGHSLRSTDNGDLHLFALFFFVCLFVFQSLFLFCDVSFGLVWFVLVRYCGNFSDGDNRQGWGVHFYCGIGWPGSSFQRSPMTEYCVEHAEAPQTDPSPGGDGYAQYVSCNSDECDGVLLPTGNVPRSPTCICWVWDDRMISQEPASRTLKACDPNDKEPWVGASQCNCSMGAKGTAAAYLEPTSPMANYVGRSKVFLPYYYYSKPMEQYV